MQQDTGKAFKLKVGSELIKHFTLVYFNTLISMEMNSNNAYDETSFNKRKGDKLGCSIMWRTALLILNLLYFLKVNLYSLLLCWGPTEKLKPFKYNK